MSDLKECNAIIKDVIIGFEDHGVFIMYLDIEGENINGYFGGYGFSYNDSETNEFHGHAFGIEFMAKILNVVGVSTMKELKGKNIRVRFKGWGSTIHSIGHIMKNIWFDPEELKEKHFG